MDHTDVIFAGGPAHNTYSSAPKPLRACIVIEDASFNVHQNTRHIYFLEYFNGRPVYLHTPLVPKNITNN